MVENMVRRPLNLPTGSDVELKEVDLLEQCNARLKELIPFVPQHALDEKLLSQVENENKIYEFLHVCLTVINNNVYDIYKVEKITAKLVAITLSTSEGGNIKIKLVKTLYTIFKIMLRKQVVNQGNNELYTQMFLNLSIKVLNNIFLY